MTMLLTSSTLVLSLFFAAPQAGDKDVKKPLASLKEIETSFDDQEKRAQKDLQEKRLAAIETYLNAKTPPSDREDALAAATELGAELEKWDKAVGFADKFIADFKTAENVVDIQMTRARCLGRSVEKALGAGAPAKPAK